MAPAAQIIKNGGLVAVPTETVYGLAANGLDEAAVRKIYEVKNARDESRQPACFVMADANILLRYPDSGVSLAEKFWPVPRTWFCATPACPTS